jgi:prepilin-type N-terminal cleavage/methylation domain-containing protein
MRIPTRRGGDSMLKRCWQVRKSDEGFTLIEVIAVVLMIVSLIAIAVPTVLSARTRALDRAAQSNLRKGISAAKAWYGDKDVYTGFDDTAGEAREPSLEWTAGAGAAVDTVDIIVVGPQELVLNALSASGTGLCIAELETTGGGRTTGEVIDAADFDACEAGTDW